LGKERKFAGGVHSWRQERQYHENISSAGREIPGGMERLDISRTLRVYLIFTLGSSID
jgi:hypothetical protein